MSYHGGSASPPEYSTDVMSPISPSSPGRQSYQRTPKRRRLASNDSIDLEPPYRSPPRFSPTEDPYSQPVFSPIQDRDVPPMMQLNNSNDPFAASQWEMDFMWDYPAPLTAHPSNIYQQAPLPQPTMTHRPSLPTQSNVDLRSLQPPPQFPQYMPMHHGEVFWTAPPVASLYSHPMPPIPYHPPYEQIKQQVAPMRPIDIPSAPVTSIPTSMRTLQRIPAMPPQPRTAPPAPRKGAISLCLSRANEKSIEDLPEHKRECPACQIEFEPDDYLAVISCCGTGMHAPCMSAWVNSQTYSKTKVCMKCRKLIDARRPLNHIVPPVTDKSWDKGVDFTAPENVKADTRVEFDISGRPDNAARRQYRREVANMIHRRNTLSVAIIPETDVPARSRGAYRELLDEQRREFEDLHVRSRVARDQWRNAFNDEARSAEEASKARERYQNTSGQSFNHAHTNAVANLSNARLDARHIQEQRHSEVRALQKAEDELKKKHSAAQIAFLERITMEQAAAARDSETSSESSSQ